MACGCAERHGSEEAGDGNCGDCRTWEEKLYWKRFIPLHFCQILLPGTEFHKQLVIPKKFARNARTMLPPKVTLRGPGGASWPALTSSRGDEAYFLDGWEAFVIAYSLQPGDVLIFKFDGVSVFDVLIFDGDNLCERELAYFVQHSEHSKAFAENQRKRLSSEVSTQEHGDDRAHKRSKFFRVYGRSRRRKSVPHICVSSSENTSPPPAEQPNTNVQSAPSDEEPQYTAEMNGNCATPAPNANDTPGNCCDEAPPTTGNKTDENGDTQATIQKTDSAEGRLKRALRSTPVRSYSALVGKRIQTKAIAKKVASSEGRPKGQLGASEPVEAITRGSPTSFNRKHLSPEGRVALEEAQQHMNKDSFIVVMRPSAVKKKFVVCVPVGWLKMHLPQENQEVFLRIGDKTWLTRLSYSFSKKTGFITNGWKQFAEENQLKLFDVCLFTFATRKDDTVTLDVSIFRAACS